jgi:hypothetical protein
MSGELTVPPTTCSPASSFDLTVLKYSCAEAGALKIAAPSSIDPIDTARILFIGSDLPIIVVLAFRS